MVETSQTFRSRVDTWYYVVLVVIGAMIAHALGRPDANVTTIGIVVLLVVGLGLPIWILLDTRYIVTADTLKVRAGPFRWTIDRRDITGLAASRSPLSSPALSLERIEIRHGRNRRLLVSPDDRDGFARALGHSINEGGSE